MDLTVHTTDTAPAGSKALLEGITEELGFVPNLAAVAAASPVLLAGFDALRRAVASGELDPVLRETAGLAVAWPPTTGTASPSTPPCWAASASPTTRSP